MSDKSHNSIIGSFLWMFFLSILLLWLPVIGQFIAGFVGGKKAGSVGRALVAFSLPAIVISIIFIFFPPLIPVMGLSVFLIMILSNFALFSGAIVGGAIA